MSIKSFLEGADFLGKTLAGFSRLTAAYLAIPRPFPEWLSGPVYFSCPMEVGPPLARVLLPMLKEG